MVGLVGERKGRTRRDDVAERGTATRDKGYEANAVMIAFLYMNIYMVGDGSMASFSFTRSLSAFTVPPCSQLPISSSPSI